VTTALGWVQGRDLHEDVQTESCLEGEWGDSPVAHKEFPKMEWEWELEYVYM
jgi:hypothetical protein